METFAMGTTFACHIVLHFSLTDLTLSDDKLFEGKYFSHMSNFETWNMHLDQIGKKVLGNCSYICEQINIFNG